ncbi:hypothetical protein E5Q_01866, partial [Mixia osmundae IAM 14324]
MAASSAGLHIPVGARVTLPAGDGVVRYAGTTEFAAGRWVGVELDMATGKNNGSVAGKVYFETEENRGVFVRPSQVKLAAGSETVRTSQRAAVVTPSTPRARPTSIAGA